MAELEVFDNNLVTTGSPADGGCCWTSFADEPVLPTDATTAMAAPWESLGDLTEDGFTVRQVRPTWIHRMRARLRGEDDLYRIPADGDR